MPDDTSISNLTDSLSAPLGDLISAVGRGVAEAQESLDAATLAGVKALYTSGDKLVADMREIGYQPTWYKIPQVDAELTVSLSVSGRATASGAGSTTAASPGAGRVRLYAAPVDATYRNRYDFDLKAASSVKFRIVPVPPSSAAADLKVVPALADKTIAEARALLDKLGISYEHDSAGTVGDSAPVTGFSPATGELLAPGKTVVLKT